ncbi:MAG: DUF1573 domain-containing protein [candidate division Zixibacteria bacterium]|nr:DUF1573 domain-containing protein [candidate division Zixibacteria bacterium]
MKIQNTTWLLILGIVVSLASSSFASNLPDLRFTEDSLNFGCVAVDFKIFHTYKLVNHGKTPIHIDTVTAHCDCSQIRFVDSLVKPYDTVEFLMIFNTADFYGPVDKNVRVHSSDKKSPKLHTYYRADIGQWLYRIQPKPVSIFMLPVKGTKIGTLINHSLDKITVIDFTLDDKSICDIHLLKDEANKGENIEYEVVANPDLTPGTHLTNFTMSIDLHKNIEPLKITIPVKIVRY